MPGTAAESCQGAQLLAEPAASLLAAAQAVEEVHLGQTSGPVAGEVALQGPSSAAVAGEGVLLEPSFVAAGEELPQEQTSDPVQEVGLAASLVALLQAALVETAAVAELVEIVVEAGPGIAVAVGEAEPETVAEVEVVALEIVAAVVEGEHLAAEEAD